MRSKIILLSLMFMAPSVVSAQGIICGAPGGAIACVIPGATVTGSGASQSFALPGQITLGNGSAALPSLNFNKGDGTLSPTLGFHVDTANQSNLVFGVSNVNRVALLNGPNLGVAVPSGGGYYFTNSTDAAGTQDTGLIRLSGGLVGVGNASTTDNVASLGNLTNRLTGISVIGLHSGATAMTFSTSSGDAVAVTLSTAQLVRFNAYGAGTLQTDGSGNITAVAGLNPVLIGTSASLGGGALLAGACASNTTTVTGATTGMAVIVDPVTYPGDGAYWDGYVSSTNNVVTKVCATVALTPGASAYNIRVIQ